MDPLKPSSILVSLSHEETMILSQALLIYKEQLEWEKCFDKAEVVEKLSDELFASKTKLIVLREG